MMIKKIFLILMGMMIVLSALIMTQGFATDNAKVVVSNVQIQPGTEMVDVTINVENNPGITFARFNVIFDDALTLVKVTDGGIWGSATHSNNYASPYGLYWNNGTATMDYTTSGTVATLTFAVEANATPGKYPITIEVMQGSTYNYADEDVVFETVEGSVTIEDAKAEAKAIEITNLTQSDKITFTAKLTSADCGYLIVARYGENGKYLGMNIYNVSDVVPISVVNDCDKVSVMWWDGFFAMRNLAPVVELDI